MEFDANGGFDADQPYQGESADYVFDNNNATDFAQPADNQFGVEQAAVFASPVPVDQFAAAAAVPAAPIAMEFTPAPVAAAPIATVDSGSSPLVEFNKKFRAQCDEKDAKERDAKAARKAAGKAALKKLLSDRSAAVDSRKASNREEERRKEGEAMNALEGESWGRVVSLIDIHAVAAKEEEKSAGGGAGGGGKGKKASGEAVPDVGRHKDVLISLKAAGGLPAPVSA